MESDVILKLNTWTITVLEVLLLSPSIHGSVKFNRKMESICPLSSERFSFLFLPKTLRCEYAKLHSSEKILAYLHLQCILIEAGANKKLQLQHNDLVLDILRQVQKSEFRSYTYMLMTVIKCKTDPSFDPRATQLIFRKRHKVASPELFEEPW